MGFGDSNKEGEKRESLIDKKMRQQQEILSSIDFDSIYDQPPHMDNGTMTESTTTKKTFFVYGDKNDGKTIISYGLLDDGDTALVLSFDNKSDRPLDAREGLKALRNAPITIKVINASVLYNQVDGPTMLETAEHTYLYVMKLLADFADPTNVKAKINGKIPDWIIIDGTERLNAIMEMYMRKSNGLMFNAGVPQHIWKVRRQYLNSIYSKSFETATKGVIYTSFCGMAEIIDSGTVVQRKEIPKWIGNVMEETDVQIRAFATRDGKKSKFTARIHGSKYPFSYPDGDYDVTDKRLSKVITNGVD
jgi:ribosomal protein L10